MTPRFNLQLVVFTYHTLPFRACVAHPGEREARALAEGLDQALREEVATKTDLVAVRTDLAADIAAVRTDVAEVRAELAAVDHKLQVEIQTAKHDVLRWIVGMAFAQTGLTVALIRFLPN